MKKALLLLPLLTSAVFASDSACCSSGLSYTTFDVGYIGGTAELPSGFGGSGIDDDLDLNGFFVAGKYQIAEGFFGYVNYQNGEIEVNGTGGGSLDIDTWRLEAGLGGHAGICDSTDVYYSAGYKFTDLDAPGADSQELGNIELVVGLRWQPAPWLEVNPYVQQSFGVKDGDALDAVDTTTVGLNLYVTCLPVVQPFAGISYDVESSDDNLVNDQLLYSAGLRFSF